MKKKQRKQRRQRRQLVTFTIALVITIVAYLLGIVAGSYRIYEKVPEETTSYANAEETVPSEEPVKEEGTPSEEPVKEEATPSEEPVKEEAPPSEEPVKEEVTPAEEEQYYEDPVPEETEYYEDPVPEETEYYEDPVPEETVYYEESVEEEPVEEEPVQEEDYWSMEFGDFGLLVLPDVGYTARLFDTTNMTTADGQKILDKENAAVIDRCPGKEISNSIYDHAGQGFDKMKKCQPGYSIARILYLDGTEDVFICTGIDYNGINDGHAIRNGEGYNVGLIDSNMMYMVTCNDSTGRSVTISYWYHIGYEKELIQGPYTDPSEYILVSEENDKDELEFDEYFERNLEEGEADWEEGESVMTIDSNH